MEVDINKTGSIYYYDSYRDGHDTSLIKDLSGTSSITSNQLIINNCDIATFLAVNKQQVEFLLQLPVAPVAGQSKVFGLKSPIGANRSAIVFDMTDDVFSAKIYKKDGSAVLFEKTIPWNSDWTAEDVRYRICLGERFVSFWIEDVCVARFGDNEASVFDFFPTIPLPIRITNNDTDDIKLSTISVY